jgi:hypothetical protein
MERISATNPAPTNRDILSEAELGLMWLQRRAELVRLEIQAIELDLALQHARMGEPDSLLSWLRKNGTPWQDHHPATNTGHFTNVPDEPREPTATDLQQHETSPTTQPLTPSAKPRSQKKPYPNLPPPANSPEPPSQPHLELTKNHNSSTISQKTVASNATLIPTTPATPLHPATKPTQSKLSTKPAQLPKPAKQPQPTSAPIPATSKTAPIAKPVPRVAKDKLQSNSPTHKTKQMPSWIVSTLVHAAILIVLMLFTFPLPEQKQTLGISGAFEPLQATPLNLDNAATEESNELENHELTAAIPESDSLENVIQNSLPSASDIASNALASPDVTSSLSPSAADGLGQIENALNSKFIDTLSTTSSLAAANFFGLEATGNIFCFVVDCSGSMRGDPFVATKQELLKTISQLKPNQRFCVFFFNQKLFPMSLEDQPAATASPATDEFRPAAVYATPENIARLQRWMETVPIGSGGPPNQALKLAIELEPDSIFLLTDGVTRSDVAGNLLKSNRQEDELDGPQIRCPIHTIGFYSREGEALLQRIATENGGQYRYVPNPQPPKKSKKMEGGS